MHIIFAIIGTLFGLWLLVMAVMIAVSLIGVIIGLVLAPFVAVEAAGKRLIQFTGPADADWKRTADRWAIVLLYGVLAFMLVAAVLDKFSFLHH